MTLIPNTSVLCADGIPLTETSTGRPRLCSPIGRAELACPDTHWCHIGSSNETTYCCPQNTLGLSPCELLTAPGYGTGAMARFWFDGTARECRQFTYTGHGGNQNNFVTEHDCEISCITSDDEDLPFVPTHSARPLANEWDLLPTVKDEEEKNVKNTYNIGASSAIISNDTRTAATIPQSELNPCSLAVDQGQSSKRGSGGEMERWYWNMQTRECTPFNYLGSGGNQNHFLSRPMCEDTCGSGPLNPSSCEVVTSLGEGSYTIPRWTYNSAKKQCSQFYYSGYAGTNNRFLTRDQCHDTCMTDRSKTVAKQQPALPMGASPCRNNVPVVTYCGSTVGAANSCPTGTYCQNGGSQTSTVCCPQAQGVNACQQSAQSGIGSQSLTRWYFNQRTARCSSFIYRGMQGNENNYMSYDSCVSACASNPCGNGSPYLQSGANLQCSSAQTGVCPGSYYCHVGPDVTNSVCCPVVGNACELPMARGSGVAQIQRFAFNTNTKQCEPFIYTGIGGYQNNFLTMADCTQMCNVIVNPCAVGTPTGQCSTANLNSCGVNYYCHVGGTAQTTVCCAKTGTNPCQLSLATGRGASILPRWYFDPITSTCKAYTYTGLRGNENNFLSLTDCRRTCPEYDNPCPAGNPPINSNSGQVSFCSNVNTACPATYWCHIGHSRQTSVCCPFANNPCTMPQALGTGVAQLPRYFYNQVLRKCEPFSYTGKAGNQNNFASLAECESICPVLDNPCANGMPETLSDGSPLLCSVAARSVCSTGYWCHLGQSATNSLCCPGAGDPCRMPLSRGNGNTVLARWYFNTDTKTCLSFSYTGRGGNQNNFVNLAECRGQCPEYQNPCSTGQPHIGLSGQITNCGAVTPSTCPTKYWCHIGSTLDTSVCCPGAGDPCALAMSRGNGQTQVCRQFSYSGFNGNENNFMTMNACEQRCPIFRNPCATSDPARQPGSNQVVTCSVRDLNTCPSTFWCHVGSDEQTTLCCPGSQKKAIKIMETNKKTEVFNVKGCPVRHDRFIADGTLRSCTCDMPGCSRRYNLTLDGKEVQPRNKNKSVHSCVSSEWPARLIERGLNGATTSAANTANPGHRSTAAAAFPTASEKVVNNRAQKISRQRQQNTFNMSNTNETTNAQADDVEEVSTPFTRLLAWLAVSSFLEYFFKNDHSTTHDQHAAEVSNKELACPIVAGLLLDGELADHKNALKLLNKADKTTYIDNLCWLNSVTDTWTAGKKGDGEKKTYAEPTAEKRNETYGEISDCFKKVKMNNTPEGKQSIAAGCRAMWARDWHDLIHAEAQSVVTAPGKPMDVDRIKSMFKLNTKLIYVLQADSTYLPLCCSGHLVPKLQSAKSR